MKVNQQENTQHCSSTKSFVGITERLVFQRAVESRKGRDTVEILREAVQ